MTLCRQVIYLVRLDVTQQVAQRAGVAQVTCARDASVRTAHTTRSGARNSAPEWMMRLPASGLLAMIGSSRGWLNALVRRFRPAQGGVRRSAPSAGACSARLLPAHAPWTMYPFSSRNSARYDPSWPVMPVTSATRGRPAGAAAVAMGLAAGHAKDCWSRGVGLGL